MSWRPAFAGFRPARLADLAAAAHSPLNLGGCETRMMPGSTTVIAIVLPMGTGIPQAGTTHKRPTSSPRCL